MARYRVDLSEVQKRPFSIGETRELSRIGGLTVGELQAVERGDLGSLPVTAMVGIVYVLIRRTRAAFTEADLNGLDWDDIEFVQPIGDDGTADPLEPLPVSKRGGRKRSGQSVATTG